MCLLLLGFFGFFWFLRSVLSVNNQFTLYALTEQWVFTFQSLPWSINSLQFQVYVQFYVSPHLVDDLKQDDWKINTTIDTHYT